MNYFVRRISQLVMIIFLPLLLTGQSVEEIISLHIEAHGGQDKWNKVEAIKIEGDYTSFSLEKECHFIKTKDGKYYGDFYVGDQNVIESWDGSKGWTIDPWQELDFPRAINQYEKNVFFQRAEFFTPFYKYQEKGSKVEYLGKEKMDGVECHVLKLTRKNEFYETWYLDAKSYLEYACISSWTDFGRLTEAETYFDDFRDVDGLIMPFFVDRTFRARNRVLQIEEVVIKPDYDKGVFTMKRRSEIGKLSFMEGPWKVKFESMTYYGQWYVAGEVTSNLGFKYNNLLQEEISYEKLFPVFRSLQIAYDGKSEKYKMTIFNDLYSEIDVLEGTLNGNILEFNDLNFVQMEGEYNKQFIYEKMEEGDLVVSFNISDDKGKTWRPVDRFTYTKE